MKPKQYKQDRAIPSIMAAASITLIGLSYQAHAGVTWIASDDGTDLTLTTDGGTLNILGTAHMADLQYRFPLHEDDPNFNWGVMWHSSGGCYAIVSDYFFLPSSEGMGTGMPSENDPWISNSPGAEVTGDSFGHHWTGLIWSEDSEVLPGILIRPLTTMVFRGLTVDSAFGKNLDNGPVLLWTHGISGDTISVARAQYFPAVKPVQSKKNPSSTLVVPDDADKNKKPATNTK